MTGWRSAVLERHCAPFPAVQTRILNSKKLPFDLCLNHAGSGVASGHAAFSREQRAKSKDAMSDLGWPIKTYHR